MTCEKLAEAVEDQFREYAAISAVSFRRIPAPGQASVVAYQIVNDDGWDEGDWKASKELGLRHITTTVAFDVNEPGLSGLRLRDVIRSRWISAMISIHGRADECCGNTEHNRKAFGIREVEYITASDVVDPPVSG